MRGGVFINRSILACLVWLMLPLTSWTHPLSFDGNDSVVLPKSISPANIAMEARVRPLALDDRAINGAMRVEEKAPLPIFYDSFSDVHSFCVSLL